MENIDKNGKKVEENSSDLHLGESGTLQTPEEKQTDNATDPRENDQFYPIDTDLRETEAQKTFGSDRAGTSERKDNTVDADDQDDQ